MPKKKNLGTAAWIDPDDTNTDLPQISLKGSFQLKRTISTQCPGPSPTYASIAIPQTQTAALVYTFGGDVEFKNDNPVAHAGDNEDFCTDTLHWRLSKW